MVPKTKSAGQLDSVPRGSSDVCAYFDTDLVRAAKTLFASRVLSLLQLDERRSTNLDIISQVGPLDGPEGKTSRATEDKVANWLAFDIATLGEAVTSCAPFCYDRCCFCGDNKETPNR